jgi:DNA-binding transcriptional MocR family regulator
MAAKHGQSGRSKDRGDHGTYIRRPFMERPAWRAMSPKAQMLYIWLKLEWKGPNHNNNGKIRLSCRQAAQRIGIAPNTAANAFHELQAKGFIVVTVLGALGVEGEARGPAYELTELKMPHSERPDGRKLYRDWAPGRDLDVTLHNANNPDGKNGKVKAHHQNKDGPIIKTVTFRPTLSSK